MQCKNTPNKWQKQQTRSWRMENCSKKINLILAAPYQCVHCCCRFHFLVPLRISFGFQKNLTHPSNVLQKNTDTHTNCVCENVLFVVPLWFMPSVSCKTFSWFPNRISYISSTMQWEQIKAQIETSYIPKSAQNNTNCTQKTSMNALCAMLK